MAKRAQSGTYRGVDTHHQVRHHDLFRVVTLFEANPVPLWHLRTTTPSDSQSICPIIPHITRVTLDILELNRLTGPLTILEEGEDIIDELLVHD